MNDKKHHQAIRKWMTDTIASGGIGRFDDLHLDQIDPAWTDRKWWVSRGLEALDIAIGLRDQYGLKVIVALAFSFDSGDAPVGGNFQGPEDLEFQLDWSPPSLYLFHREMEPWKDYVRENPTHGLDIVSKIDCSRIVGELSRKCECYYFEYLQKDVGEYRRSLFVAA